MSWPQRVILAACLVCSVGCSAQEPADFESFWQGFRQASAAGDVDALVRMTRLPLEVRGVDDGQPVLQVEAGRFAEVMRRILAQQTFYFQGDDLVEADLASTLEHVAVPEPEPAEGSVRVSQFEFARVDGEWRLVRAYLEE